jgi:predicted metal-binding membrane protein
MSGLDRLSAWSGFDAVAFPVLASHPWLNRLAAVCSTSAADWTLETVLLHVTMWLAMAVAMMLPTATPMLRTYAEIADTAAERGRRVVSPVVLAIGYLTIWSTFAIVATGLQWGLSYVGALSSAGAVASAGIAIAILAGAGLYQFTNQKHACLVKCSNPFPFLFANWTERTKGVFRLGLREGLHCLACCWALMLVMFAVGTMNIVWIAVLTVVMAAEKLIGARWFSRAIGIALLAWAAVAAAGLPLGGV